MSNIKKFSSRKEVTEFLKEKGIDTSNWSEEKWLSINKGQAEIHMMALAEAIWDSVNESTPKQLQAGEYHIPFGNIITENSVDSYFKSVMDMRKDGLWGNELIQKTRLKVAVAMAARTSYTVVGDEKEINYQKMIDLHDRLITQNPPHSSPLEHIAQVPTQYEYDMALKGEEKGWFYNLKGFKSYRHIIETQNK